MDRTSAFQLVDWERRRQQELWGDWTAAGDVSLWRKLAILAEEFGEVARALNDNEKEDLERELVHVAAVAVAWLESLEYRGEGVLEHESSHDRTDGVPAPD